jgi:hypothetical protein
MREDVLGLRRTGERKERQERGKNKVLRTEWQGGKVTDILLSGKRVISLLSSPTGSLHSLLFLHGEGWSECVRMTAEV